MMANTLKPKLFLDDLLWNQFGFSAFDVFHLLFSRHKVLPVFKYLSNDLLYGSTSPHFQ